MTRIARVAVLLTLSALAASTATITAVPEPEAGASTPPTLHLNLPNDMSRIGYDYNGSPDGTNKPICTLHVGPIAMTNQFSIVTGTMETKNIPNGANAVWVVCGQSRSNTVTLYLPRDPLNDARTLVSDATRGMFGS
ncbi:hypothetical protein [Gordonia sp. (in: high G+C Gram-positive bacteria)]|uniref:hypothetical protein n=1 Tax=Gordonia sp. (in: high G+C Gram-positive bacteria) TaxID=84139 RepID=UPI003529ADD3